MAILDTPLRSAASTLISKFGKTVLFRTGEQREYDVTTGGPRGTYDDEFEAKVIIEDVNRDGSQQTQRERDEGGVRRSMKLTVADADLGGRTPSKNWTAVLDHDDDERAKAYRVSAPPVPTYSGDNVAIWELTVRR